MRCMTEWPTAYIYVTKVYYSCKAWSFILTRDSSRWSSRNICLPRKEPLTIFFRMDVFNFIIFSVRTKWHLALVVRDSHPKQFSKKSLLIQTVIFEEKQQWKWLEGEINSLQVSGRFELQRVRVTGSQLYIKTYSGGFLENGISLKLKRRTHKLKRSK